MESTSSQTQSQVHHSHPTKPKDFCAACSQRFGTVVMTTNEIAGMLDDSHPVEAAALVQLVWTSNKHLDRIATALEALAEGR